MWEACLQNISFYGHVWLRRGPNTCISVRQEFNKIVQTPNIIYPCAFFLLSISDHKWSPHAINSLNAICTLNGQFAEWYSVSSSPNKCLGSQFAEWNEEWEMNWAIFDNEMPSLTVMSHLNGSVHMHYLVIHRTDLLGIEYLMNWLNTIQPTDSSKYR